MAAGQIHSLTGELIRINNLPAVSKQNAGICVVLADYRNGELQALMPEIRDRSQEAFWPVSWPSRMTLTMAERSNSIFTLSATRTKTVCSLTLVTVP